MLLSECANVRSGLLLSRKLAKTQARSVKTYKQLTLKSINADGTVNKDLLEYFPASEVLSSSYLTREGDVIVRLTEPYTAVSITEDLENLVIPSHFIAIRPDSEILLPDFFAWLLNDDCFKQQIKKQESGSVLSLMKRSNYENLNIELLPLDKQKIISDINRLSLMEASLYKRMAEEKIKLAKAINKSIYNKEK